MIGQSLLRKPGERPLVCYCPPGVCQAPKGFRGPCNRATNAAAAGEAEYQSWIPVMLAYERCRIAIEKTMDEFFAERPHLKDPRGETPCYAEQRRPGEWVCNCTQMSPGCKPAAGVRAQPTGKTTDADAVQPCDRCGGTLTVVTWGGGEQKPCPKCADGVQEARNG